MSHNYLIPCDCGHDLAVKSSDAGRVVRCPYCQAQHMAPRLSALRRLPIVAGLAQECGAFQCSPQTLLTSVALAALFLACSRWFGFKPMGGIVLVSAAWGLGAAVFHRAFVNATVIGGVMALFAAITLISLLDSRVAARRNQGTDNLRQIGTAFQAANDYRSPGQEALSPAK